VTFVIVERGVLRSAPQTVTQEHVPDPSPFKSALEDASVEMGGVVREGVGANVCDHVNTLSTEESHEGL